MGENEKYQRKYEKKILSDFYPKYDLLFKTILTGNFGVSKTCLSYKAIKQTYYPSTLGYQYLNLKFNEKVINFQIWDTFDHELYGALIINFCRNASLSLLVFVIDE